MTDLFNRLALPSYCAGLIVFGVYLAAAFCSQPKRVACLESATVLVSDDAVTRTPVCVRSR